MTVTYTVHPEVTYIVHRNWSGESSIGTEIAGEFYSLEAAERAAKAMQDAEPAEEIKAGLTD